MTGPEDTEFDLSSLQEAPPHVLRAIGFYIALTELQDSGHVSDVHIAPTYFNYQMLAHGGRQLTELTQSGKAEEAQELAAAIDHFDQMSPDKQLVGTFIVGPDASRVRDIQTRITALAADSDYNGILDPSTGNVLVPLDNPRKQESVRRMLRIVRPIDPKIFLHVTYAFYR